MKIYLYFTLFVFVLSCKQTEPTTPQPGQEKTPDTVLDEYANWYTIKSPVDHEILGVWGNYDKTLLISTGLNLFRSNDRGKQWEKVYESKTGIFGVVQYQDTLFAMNGLASNNWQGFLQQMLVTADSYSTNDGKSWERYKGSNRVLFELPENESGNKFLVNPIVASNSQTYTINKVFKDGPNATIGTFITPGVITANGRRIDLPQLHQLQSLYLDEQQRLYLVGSDAVCGSESNFKFCNSNAGRGVVYISKKPLP